MKSEFKSLAGTVGRWTSTVARGIRTDRRARIIAVALVVVLGLSVFFFFRWINSRIRYEGERVEVQVARLRAPSTDGLAIYMNASDVRAVKSFAGARYLATSGGLIETDESGSIRRRFTTSDGFPENDLTSLAVFRDRLFIGTSASGLISYDGTSFTGYRFIKPKATRVSALVATESELLIGTLDGGMFEYDGETFTRRYNSTAGADFNKVTALLPYESRLYIGTLDAGLYIWREARIERVTTTEGLPSPNVTALARLPDGLSDNGVVAVATDFGVVGLNDANEAKAITSRPNITSLAVSGDRLWAGFFTGGVIDLSAEFATRKGATNEGRTNLSDAPGLPRTAPAIVQAGDGMLWALTKEGAFVRDEQSAGPGFEPFARALSSGNLLTSDHITGLALDNSNRLWVGYFDRGIDTLSLETNERLSHIEDDRVMKINHVAYDSSEGRMLVATSRGLVMFDGGANRSVLTREQNNLVDNSIMHVSIANVSSPIASNGAPSIVERESRAIVVATSNGLSEVLGGRVRSITAFHGLTSNRLYSTAQIGSRLFVGSLAGLVELEGLRVVRTYKPSSPGLSDDWVTALAVADGVLYIGTQEGGVDALLPTGEWVKHSEQTGKFEVSPNAMHFDGEKLYVGSGDRGLLVYNVRARRWTTISAGLTSQTVTAVTSDDRFVYVGTMNGLVRIEKRVIE